MSGVSTQSFVPYRYESVRKCEIFRGMIGIQTDLQRSAFKCSYLELEGEALMQAAKTVGPFRRSHFREAV